MSKSILQNVLNGKYFLENHCPKGTNHLPHFCPHVSRTGVQNISFLKIKEWFQWNCVNTFFCKHLKNESTVYLHIFVIQYRFTECFLRFLTPHWKFISKEGMEMDQRILLSKKHGKYNWKWIPEADTLRLFIWLTIYLKFFSKMVGIPNKLFPKDNAK